MEATEEPPSYRGHSTWMALASAGDMVAAPDHCPQGMGTSTEVVARLYPSQPSPPEGSPAPGTPSSPSPAPSHPH